MRLIHVIGCCLTLAIVLTPSDAKWPFGKKNTKPNADPKPTGDVQDGLVKDKTAAAPSTDPLQEASGDSKTEADTKSGTVPTITVDKKIMTNRNSEAVVAAGATAVAAAQNQIEKNQEETKKLEKKLEKLDNEMITNIEDESSFSDLTNALVDIAKRRIKIKAALVVYGIINLILYVAQFAGSMITPSVGKFIFLLDLLAKKVISKPLDDYYADFQRAQAEAVAQYVDKHRDEFKNPKIGKKVLVRTKSNKQSYILLKKNPGDPVDPKFLTVTNKNPMEVARLAVQFR